MKKEYNFSKLKEVKNPYPSRKKAVGINLSPKVLDYFKALAAKTGLPYQKLIDLYLLDCAKKRRKLSLKWVAQRFAASHGGEAIKKETYWKELQLAREEWRSRHPKPRPRRGPPHVARCKQGWRD